MLESKGSGAAERLGLGEGLPEELNPRPVRVAISPFGLSGPHAQWTGNDMIAFHASGFAFGFPALQVETLDLPLLQAPSHAAALLTGETDGYVKPSRALSGCPSRDPALIRRQ
jgi:crotonobetainyl-CoA:carnitine CoA-transferase CaiB-like acyl-CoA transferase